MLSNSPARSGQETQPGYVYTSGKDEYRLYANDWIQVVMAQEPV